MAIKANPHMPPWLFQKNDDLQMDILHALDTGELVWIKDPKQRKSRLTTSTRGDLKEIGFGGMVLLIVWTVWALFTVNPSLAASEGFQYLIRLGWSFLAWGLPIVFLRGEISRSSG